MPVQVRIPAMWRSHVGGSKAVEGEPGAIGDLLKGLTAKYPGLKDQFFDDQGALHQFVNVYVNDEDVRYLDSLHTKVSDGDAVSILPAIAGGEPAHRVS